ncbi:uncharacterized protein [Bactrocera oleae]|uniref:uncharacterized protein n=1 Tax=Bactrocera oleae TaxID=104688 RepID=UPI00387EB176
MGNYLFYQNTYNCRKSCLKLGFKHLWHFQNFGNWKGHHMLFDKGLQCDIDIENFEQNEPMRPQTDTGDLLTLAMSDAFATSFLAAIKGKNDGKTSRNINTDGDEWHEQEATYHISAIYSTTTMQPTIGKAVGATLEFDSPHSPHARWQKQGVPKLVTGATSNHFTYEWRIGDWSACSEKCVNAAGLRLAQ